MGNSSKEFISDMNGALIEDLDDDCFALMVLRQFNARIRSALLRDLQCDDDWESMMHCNHSVSILVEKLSEDCAAKKRSCDYSKTSQCIVIQVPSEKCGRKDTKLDIMIVSGLCKQPNLLPPMARQQISWCHKLTHRFIAGSTYQDDNQLNMNLGLGIFHHLLSRTKNAKDEVLRIDSYPKTIALNVCKALQHHALKNTDSKNVKIEELNTEGINDDPYASGPLKFSMSISRASFVISVIEVEEGKEYMFGIATKEEHWSKLNSKMNQFAAKEVCIEPMNSQSGSDMNQVDQIKIHAPVSRAYYKLEQVFDDYLPLRFCSLAKNGGVGIDLGSSPGGWTQALHFKAGTKKVLSIDPGILAERVINLRGIKHCRHDFTSKIAENEIASFGPFSLVVCDACADASDIIPMITNSFNKIHATVKEEEQDKMFLLTKPSAMVVTIKMPSRSSNNQTKILKQVQNQLSESGNVMANWSGSDKTEFKIVHLFANSETERTLIITFY